MGEGGGKTALSQSVPRLLKSSTTQLETVTLHLEGGLITPDLLVSDRASNRNALMRKRC